jgi:hypothetical protein
MFGGNPLRTYEGEICGRTGHPIVRFLYRGCTFWKQRMQVFTFVLSGEQLEIIKKLKIKNLGEEQLCQKYEIPSDIIDETMDLHTFIPDILKS